VDCKSKTKPPQKEMKNININIINAHTNGMSILFCVSRQLLFDMRIVKYPVSLSFSHILFIVIFIFVLHPLNMFFLENIICKTIKQNNYNYSSALLIEIFRFTWLVEWDRRARDLQDTSIYNIIIHTCVLCILYFLELNWIHLFRRMF
jgi:hypothetical protein